ncbi:uncharacterized protein NPIL_377921 [Nephila pilipes]|uniref:Uncharacterized protein n=1 Tax=Nephila pilipes TaxID=299642 RepID=A0A8X6ILY9_NEPPI|nr:uncharacterized protein NPIL_377921 [Nephila pilipes]
MKNPITVKNKKNKQNVETGQIRRWILKCVSNTTPETAITLQCVKKFLDSKQNGVSSLAETKSVLKDLLDRGHLIKINGRIASGKIGQKQQLSEIESVPKNLTNNNKNRKSEQTDRKEAEAVAKRVLSIVMETESTGKETEIWSKKQGAIEKGSETASKKVETVGKETGNVDISTLERIVDDENMHKINIIHSAQINKKEKSLKYPKRRNSKLKNYTKSKKVRKNEKATEKDTSE